MMDWFTKWLPDSTDLYWAVVCVALAVLNVWQFARTRDLSGTLKLLFEHGHAPEGKALVPVEKVTVTPTIMSPLPIATDEPRIVPAATRPQTTPKGYL